MYLGDVFKEKINKDRIYNNIVNNRKVKKSYASYILSFAFLIFLGSRIFRKGD